MFKGPVVWYLVLDTVGPDRYQRPVSRVLDETRGCGRVCRRSREAYDALPETLPLTLGDILAK